MRLTSQTIWFCLLAEVLLLSQFPRECEAQTAARVRHYTRRYPSDQVDPRAQEVEERRQRAEAAHRAFVEEQMQRRNAQPASRYPHTTTTNTTSSGPLHRITGVWSINVPGPPSIQIFLSIQPDGTYATYRGSLNSPTVETGRIDLSNRSTYTLTAETGINAGRRDRGSIRFTASNQVWMSGQYGSGTWTKVPGASQPFIAANQHPQSPYDQPQQRSSSGSIFDTVNGSAHSETTPAPLTVPSQQVRSQPGSEVTASMPPVATSFRQPTATPPANPTISLVALNQINQPAPVKSVSNITTPPPTAAISNASIPPSSAVPAKAAPPKDRPIKDKWALVIGISKFQKPELDLKCAATDARDFGNFLVKECNFAADHVHVLTDAQATRAQVLNELGDKWLPRVVRPDDLVVVYVSTHGSPSDVDLGGINYLLTWDTDPDSLYASGLPMQDLMRLIKGRLRSDRVMIVLDACYSGNVNPQGKGLHRGGNLDIDDVVQGTGQLVISSSESNQISWESKTGANSVFTKHLMAALRSNGAKTKLGDAFKTLKESVEDEVQRDRGKVQIPVLKSQWEGSDLMLAVPPSDARPGL